MNAILSTVTRIPVNSISIRQPRMEERTRERRGARGEIKDLFVLACSETVDPGGGSKYIKGAWYI